jgi:ubiquinone/menaquinone biosynthesis C-methylase UbiE
VRVRITVIVLLTRFVEGVGSLISQIQFLLYGALPALLPPDALSALIRTYYNRSYSGLDREFRADEYKWALDDWEEAVTARHMSVKGTVVVLGAGLGRESIALAQGGHRVLGLDNNHNGLHIAARQASLLNLPVTFAQADFQLLPIGEQKTDYVFLSSVMYSAIPGKPQRQECVRRFRSTLQRDGKIVLNFLLSHEWQTKTHRMIDGINRWLLKLPGSNQAYQLGDFCSHGHFMHAFLDEAEIRSELTEAGATILELNWNKGYAVLA